MIATGVSIPLLCLEGVPDLSSAPKDIQKSMLGFYNKTKKRVLFSKEEKDEYELS